MRDSAPVTSTHHQVLEKFTELYHDLFQHDGYGDIRVELKIKKAGQKEVIIHCGKQHRFFVDFRNTRRGRALIERQSARKSAPRNENEN